MQLFNIFSRQPAVRSPREFNINDWKEALLATKAAISSKRIGILAAGIAYFMTLAFFPLIAALIATASFIVDPDQIKDIAAAVEHFLPSDLAGLVNAQLKSALGNKASSTIIAIVSILIALFSISGAAQNAISASNAAYDVEEDRNFIKLRLVSLAVIFIFLVGGIFILMTMLLNKQTLVEVGLNDAIATGASVVRWLLLPVVLSIMLACFYRYGPNRPSPKWQWVSWGSVVASILWLLITIGFFVYIRYFANFSKSYGTFAGIIILMTWLNLSAFVILLGAEVNHRLERQTSRKTTK